VAERDEPRIERRHEGVPELSVRDCGGGSSDTPAEQPCACLVTLDVEADDQWKRPEAHTFDNIGALPKFQTLCNEFGIRPTYLVTYQVVSHSPSREILQSLADAGNCEIGAHCHAWSTLPYDPSLDTGEWRTLMYEYPPELQEEKLQNVTRLLREAFGRSPLAHRAGRWALDATSLSILERLGYAADSSVTPLINWHSSCGARLPGPCYAAAPRDPYYPSSEDVTRPGSTRVLEVPLTVDLAWELPNWLSRSLVALLARPDRKGGQLLRILRKAGLARTTCLRPTHCAGPTMVALSKRRLRQGADALTYMVHSSELVPGRSPRVPDLPARDCVWQGSRQLFAHWAAARRTLPMGLGEFAINGPRSDTAGRVRQGNLKSAIAPPGRRVDYANTKE